MTVGPRPRGRPKNSARPRVAAADQAIALTVWQLLSWGFPLRRAGGVADVVAAEAATLLQRTDHAGRPLGHKAIEKIFRTWHASAYRTTGWVTAPRMRYETVWKVARVEWLRSNRPWRPAILSLGHRPDRPGEMQAAARRLLQNGGIWPERSGNRLGDVWLTAKPAREQPRLLFPEPENGPQK